MNIEKISSMSAKDNNPKKIDWNDMSVPYEPAATDMSCFGYRTTNILVFNLKTHRFSIKSGSELEPDAVIDYYYTHKLVGNKSDYFVISTSGQDSIVRKIIDDCVVIGDYGWSKFYVVVNIDALSVCICHNGMVVPQSGMKLVEYDGPLVVDVEYNKQFCLQMVERDDLLDKADHAHYVFYKQFHVHDFDVTCTKAKLLKLRRKDVRIYGRRVREFKEGNTLIFDFTHKPDNNDGTYVLK